MFDPQKRQFFLSFFLFDVFDLEKIQSSLFFLWLCQSLLAALGKVQAQLSLFLVFIGREKEFNIYFKLCLNSGLGMGLRVVLMT